MNKIIKIAILLIVISSCSNRVHVITEWDGDREIRWYSTKEKETHIMKLNIYDRKINKQNKRI